MHLNHKQGDKNVKNEILSSILHHNVIKSNASDQEIRDFEERGTTISAVLRYKQNRSISTCNCPI